MPVVQPPVNQPRAQNQYDKLRTGAVLVLRNADLNQPVRIPNTNNGTQIFLPMGLAINIILYIIIDKYYYC